MLSGKFTNIITQTTTIVRSKKGILHRIVINKATVNGVIAVYDGDAATGTLIATITSPATLLQNHIPLEYNLEFQDKLTIVTSGANQDITVVSSAQGSY